MRFIPASILFLVTACFACGGAIPTKGDGGTTSQSSSSSASSSGGTPSSSSSSSSSGTGGSTGATSSSSSTGGTTGSTLAPLVISTLPLENADNVSVSTTVSADFNEAVNPLTASSAFTLANNKGVDLPAIVICAGAAVSCVLTPVSALTQGETYTATIAKTLEGADGVHLLTAFSWTFTTRLSVSPAAVDLGTAGDFVILAETEITVVPTSAITGNVAISPSAATFITGLSLIADKSNVFSTSSQVTGQVFAADYAPPTPANLTTAIGDMDTAFTDAAGRAPNVTELGAGNISGMTLGVGVYKWSTGLLLATDVYLNGSATDVFIFEVAQSVTVDSAVKIHLTGGAIASNVFWQVSGQVNIGTTAHFEGVILCQTQIAMKTGASINGRLLAQSAVIADSNTIVQP